jgi:predicted dehydrogenase
MNSHTESILFIGGGKWSKKVSEIIAASDASLEPVVISARNYLENGSAALPKGANLKNFKFIWITTFPDVQLKILNKLQDLNTKIILEKPLALTIEDIQKLSSIIPKMKSTIYLSQPWTFSNLWESARMQMSGYLKGLEIHSVRQGELQREAISPSLDWLPHDLYLLASLMQSKGLKNDALKLLSSRGSFNQVLLDYQIGADARLSFQAGKSETRRANWCISVNAQTHLEIDFDSRKIIKKEGNTELVENFDSDNPIISMLENYGACDSDVNWELILKLCSDAILAVSGDQK